MKNIKLLFHRHSVVPTYRRLIGVGFKVVSQEIEKVNYYLNKGYCIKCKQRLAWKSEVLDAIDIKQPYDRS